MSCDVGEEAAWREGRGECWTTLGCVEWVAEVVTVDKGILTSASPLGRLFFFLKHTTQQTTPIRTVAATIITITTAEGLEPEDKQDQKKKRLSNLREK